MGIAYIILPCDCGTFATCAGCLESGLRNGADEDGNIEEKWTMRCECRAVVEMHTFALAIRAQFVNAFGEYLAKWGEWTKYLVMIDEMFETGLAPTE
jgi:hypothetical protein